MRKGSLRAYARISPGAGSSHSVKEACQLSIHKSLFVGQLPHQNLGRSPPQNFLSRIKSLGLTSRGLRDFMLFLPHSPFHNLPDPVHCLQLLLFCSPTRYKLCPPGGPSPRQGYRFVHRFLDVCLEYSPGPPFLIPISEHPMRPRSPLGNLSSHKEGSPA